MNAPLACASSGEIRSFFVRGGAVIPGPGPLATGPLVVEAGRRVATPPGVAVIIAARDEQRSKEAVVALQSEDIQASAITLDVTDTASVAEAVDHVTSEHGRLDILVNNAGILPEATAPDASQPLDVELFA